uniref:DNA-directed RNA polymerase III subunit RPC3 n=1 Tax=Strigamia maritima TaxID=126957 RepID=T1IZX1_STRMM
MSKDIWLMDGILDHDKLPESDSEDDSDNSLQNDSGNEAINSNGYSAERQEAEKRIKLCGHKQVFFHHTLLKTLEMRVGNRYMDLLALLCDCDHDELQIKIDYHHNLSRINSELYIGLHCINDEIPDQKLTWKKVLSALMKINRWDVLRALFSPDLDEYWNKGSDCGAKSSVEHTFNLKQPVESLDFDSRPENYRIPQTCFPTGPSRSDMQDSGINSASAEQAISSSFSNMTIGNNQMQVRSGGANPNGITSQQNGLPQPIPTAMPQNQFSSLNPPWQIAMMCQHPQSLYTQANTQYVSSYMNNSDVWSQQQSMFAGTPSLMLHQSPSMQNNGNSMTFQSSLIPMSFEGGLPTLPIASNPRMNDICSPPTRNVINNEVQMSANFAQRNHLNNSISTTIPRGVFSEPVDEITNQKWHVLLTYSLDAEKIAKELQLRLWEDFSILAMTAQQMRNRIKHTLGEDVNIRCRDVKFVVPLLSKKYIADIGYGYLLENEYVSTLYDSDQSKIDRDLVSSIYTKFVNMCLTAGGRNYKVRPLSVIRNSYDICQHLHPCLLQVWHLWQEFEDFVDIINTDVAMCTLFTGRSLLDKEHVVSRRFHHPFAKMTQVQNDLALKLLQEHFGDIVMSVGRCLLERGTSPIGEIIQQTNESITSVKNSLVVLIQHDLVSFQLNSRGIVSYQMKSDDVYPMLSYPLCIDAAEKLFNAEGKLIVEQIILCGKLKLTEIVEKVKNDSAKIAKPIIQEQMIINKFTNMVDDHYIQRCSTVVQEPNNIQLLKPHEDELYLLPDCDDNGRPKKRLQLEGSESQNNEVFWKLNANTFNLYLRNQIIIKSIEKKFDSTAAIIIETMLKLMESYKNIKCIDSNPISKFRISNELPPGSGILPPVLDQYLTRLSEDSVQIISKVDDHQGGMYCLRLARFINSLTWAMIERIIEERTERNRNYVDDTSQGCEADNLYTFRGKFNSFARSSSNFGLHTHKNIFLFCIRFPQVVRMLLEWCHKSLFNLKVARECEMKQNKRLLEKKQKINAIIEAMKIQNTDPNEIAEVEGLITPPETLVLENVQKASDKLETGEINLLECLLIFKLCIDYYMLK